VNGRRKLASSGRYRLFVGVGGVGTGMFFALEGNATLGRNESRPGRLLDVRDYCKLHIIAHYFSTLVGCDGAEAIHVIPIGKVGADEAGRRLVREMADAGIDTRFVTVAEGKPTLLSVCFQYPDGSGGNITTSDAAASALHASDIDRAESATAASVGSFIALAAPEVPLDERYYLLRLATKHKGLRVAGFASAEMPIAAEMGMLPLVDIISLNEDEAAAIAHAEFDADHVEPFLDSVAAELTLHNPEMRIILSAGKDGAYGFDRGIWRHSPTPAVTVASSAGAGDALLGATLAGLAAGMPFISSGPMRNAVTDGPAASALDFAAIFAALTVTSPHTIHPEADLDAVLAFAKGLGVSFASELHLP
jgi:sugar/nucleoside kinase (ribokinase family)